MTTRRRRFVFRFSRDTLIICVGLVGLWNETFRVEEPRDVLVWLFGGMVLGVPFLRQGDHAADKEDPPKTEEESKAVKR